MLAVGRAEAEVAESTPPDNRMASSLYVKIDSYTSTVGQYRTYPPGFTHNHIAWEPEPSWFYMSWERTRAPRPETPCPAALGDGGVIEARQSVSRRPRRC